jgi:aspartate/methionine/tyrosine aminotransferase
MVGGRAVTVPTGPGFQLDVDAIRRAITPRARAVVTVSPNNPTGAVYPERALREVNAICAGVGVYHVHDEAYEYFTYGGASHFSPAAIPASEPHTICLHSLSKSYGFASWRIGSMLIPAHLYEAVRKIQDTILICPPVISQFAAVGALHAGRSFCDHHLPALGRVRHTFLEQMASLRGVCDVPPADGAFYFFLTVHSRMNALDLVERLVREHGVAVMPGTTFGVEDRCALRVSYGSLQPETAIEGVGRLVRGLKAIVKR